MGRLADSLLPATTIYRPAVWCVYHPSRDERLAVAGPVDSGGTMTINFDGFLFPAFLALLGLCVGGGVSSYGFYRLLDGRDGIVTYLYWIGGAASCLLIGWVSADMIGLLLLNGHLFHNGLFLEAKCL